MGKLRAKLSSKKTRRWIIASAIAVLALAFFGYRWWHGRATALPKGIAGGNGRLEAKEVDIASKLPLRVKEVRVDEGDLVKPGQVVVLMDTTTLESELAEAEQSVAAAREQMAVAKAAIARRGSEIELAKIEKERSRKLVEQRAGSQREYDVRNMALKTTTAGLAEERAKLEVATEQVKVAEAQVQTVQSRIDDATLRSPVLGRVLYRLAEPGEVLGPGGKALTLVNLEDVYMEIFLPSNQAAALKIGDEARFKLDFAPDRVVPGTVSYVSPEAQFTPKQVETKSEREKLMFRVKIKISRELVTQYVDRIKTGVRGTGYVRTKPEAHWPAWLDETSLPPSASQPPPAVSEEPAKPTPPAEPPSARR